MKELWQIVVVQEKMLLRLQRSWKSHNRVQKAVAAVALQRRRLKNPYEHRGLGMKVLEDVWKDTSMLYDPFDIERGMCLTMWLRNLGCSHLRPPLQKLDCKDPESVKMYALANPHATFMDDGTFERIVKLAQGNVKAAQKFQVISDWSEVNRMFRAKYGKNFKAKANGFVKALKGHPVSLYMVEQLFLVHSKNANAARDAVGDLLSNEHKVDEDTHDKARMHKCADLYRYAIEKCLDLLTKGFLLKEIQLSFETMIIVPSVMIRLVKFRAILDKLRKWNNHAVMVQQNWRWSGTLFSMMEE